MVVVGAGHNGLVCAIQLARAGARVLLLEATSSPGGAVTSSEATLPGFVHDTGSGFFPMTVISPAFEAIPLEALGLRWVRPDVAMAHPFASGEAIALHRDVAATAENIERIAPGDGRAWESLVRRLAPHRRALARAVLGPFPPLRAGARLMGALRQDAVELGRRALGSAAALQGDLFRHEAPAAWIAGSAMHAGLGPHAAGGGGFGLWLTLLGHLASWPYPAGGAGRLAAALTEQLRAAGGELACDSPVTGISVSRGSASAVRLAGGEEVGASAVVVTVSARRLADMLPAHSLPERLFRRLQSWRYGPGVFKADFALDGPVPWRSAVCREAGVVHLGDTIAAIDRSLQGARSGKLPEAPELLIGQHSLHDPSRAPAGKHTLYAYTHVPWASTVVDDEVGDRIERRIESFAPGFRHLVLARALLSPRALERQNPSLVRGDILGGSCDPDQQLVFRPAPELFRHRTPIRGLYVGSASTHPGGGVHGAAGAGAARALLRDRSPLRHPLGSSSRLWRPAGRRDEAPSAAVPEAASKPPAGLRDNL